MRVTTIFSTLACACASLLAAPVLAEPGDSFTLSGTTAAEVAEPGALVKLEDLRFGTFARPSTAATMSITANGTVTATGEVATTMNTYPSPGGRGPAVFNIQGTDSRFFIPFYPSTVTITNGTSTMLVDQMQDNVFFVGFLNASGQYTYRIGGRLNVNANQEPGEYSGDFQVTVLFL